MSIEDIRAGQLQGHGDEALVPVETGVIFTRLEPANGQCVLQIKGDLDIAVSGLLGHELDELLELDLGVNRVAVDLSGVLFMDSSALSALVQARERAKVIDRQFSLLNPSPACAKVLSITGLDRVFDAS